MRLHQIIPGWQSSLLLSVVVIGITSTFDVVYAATTADHSRFDELQQEFSSGPEVTRACLKCHNQAARQIQKTEHWTWEFLNPTNRQTLGKRNILNNFCITPQSNYAHCTSCHVGYGWRDEQFDFTAEDNVDCLVCHDTTGEYRKASGMAGYPEQSVDLTFVAQYVGKTSRATCGACHFYGGGGNGVKHGDMDDSLANPSRDLDVHMDAKGENFACATCHKPIEHNVGGSRYTPDAVDQGGYHMHKVEQREESNAHCQACHGNAPHKSAEKARLDHHARRIACQTCHIPRIARGGIATRMSWDWSTAGRLDANGEPITEWSNGNLVYHGKRGSFTYAKDIAPDYIWFNGQVAYQPLNEEITPDTDGVVELNRFAGSADDGRARIWPVKIFRGVQPYDPVLNRLVVPQTEGDSEAAYWRSFDWEKAVAAGMRSAELPFSGSVGFIKTRMYWLITHMVAPAEESLGCDECHRKDGRLQNVKGIYIPGRDTHDRIDLVGWSLVLLTLAGVLTHGLGRIVSRRLWRRP